MGLNKEQTEVVNSNASKILCLAGAGTGKTHSMISRINRLVNEEKVIPMSILVLTFTEAAAFEMEGRYKRNSKVSLSPTFCTFHKFCYSRIINNLGIRRKLGYSEIPKVVEDSEYKSIITKLKMKLGLKISDKKLFGKEMLSMKEQYEYNVLQKALTTELKRQNLITFDLMCYEVCELFVNDDPLIQQYKNKYKYVFVDEFQDTDPKQYKFICSFTNSSLFVVGDIQQAIYGFRGADSSIIKSLADSNEWTTIKLVHNYRSTKQICDFSNNICKLGGDIKEQYVIDLEADRNGPEVKSLYTDVSLKYLLKDNLLKSGMAGTTAILLRTNAEVKMIRQILDNMRIAYTTNSNKDEEIESILKCCIDEDFALSYLSSKLDSNTYSEYMRLTVYDDDEYNKFNKFIELYGNHYAVAKYYSTIRSIKSLLNHYNKTPYQKCLDICNKLNIYSTNIKLEGNTDSEIINAVLLATKSNESYNIYVGTIHSSKGLEYNNVLVFGVAGSKFKLTNEENRNIYYVACTRAKDNLTVFRGDI